MGELRWSEEQQELASMLTALLSKHSDSTAVRQALEAPKGYDEKLWSLLCEQVGVAALTVPEEHGGGGVTFPPGRGLPQQLGRVPIGRAACWGKGEILVGGGSFKKKKKYTQVK